MSSASSDALAPSGAPDAPVTGADPAPDQSSGASSAATDAAAGESKTPETKTEVVGPLPYHELNTAAQSDGYFGRLDEYQSEKLSRMIALLEEHKLDYAKYLQAPGETRDHMLLRFLRARKFKVTAAWELFHEDFKWRERMDVLSLRVKKPEEVLGVKSMATMNKFLPGWIQGVDKQGRPIIFKRFGHTDVAAICQETTVEKMLDHHIWLQENMMAKLAESSAKTGKAVETILAVFDASGWRIGLATRLAYSFLKGMADLDSVHYPERLGQIVVLNSPYMLAVAWRVIRGWLDERTKNKIHIVRGIDEFGPILKDLIDEDVLPVEWGGKGVSLEPSAVAVAAAGAGVDAAQPETDAAGTDDAAGLAIAKEMAGASAADAVVYDTLASGLLSPTSAGDAAAAIAAPTPTPSPAPGAAAAGPGAGAMQTESGEVEPPKVHARRSSWWPFGGK